MKSILKLVVVLVLFSSTKSFSQGESWNWYFGYTAGVNFPNAGPPVAVLNGMLSTLEGVATISDASGALLFYTHGSTVWNKNHAVMANGNGLMGNGSSTQSGVIIPHPGNPNLYYIFTVNTFNQGLRYSIVDMSLSAGNGSVTVKNSFLWQNNTEKCCAVRHCNGVDYWVVCHDGGNNQFRSYLVTAAGLNPVPVLSSAGSNHASPGIGYLKASPDGSRLAYAVYINGFLEILDFNKSTGVVSNPITITGAQYSNAYGCEFSPDNSKVYFGSYSTKNITQVNLCAGTNAQIIASAMVVGTSLHSVGALQLGPDQKIYVARSQAPWLGVINNPNVLGVGCGFVDNGVTLNGRNCGAGLPNFISSYFLPPPPPFTSTVNCLNVAFTSPTVNITNCSTSSNAITSYSWNFGDPSSGPANTSALANPTHAYSGPGTFTVNLILGYACGSDTISQPVTVISCSPMVSVNSETICSGTCAVLTATANGGTPPYTYAWSPNIGSTAGPFTVCPNATTIYTVTITDDDNNVVSNTSTVLVNTTPTVVVTPSSPTMCMNNFNGSTNTITINAFGATSFSWTGIMGVTTNTTEGTSVIATSIPGTAIGTGSVIGTIGTCTSVVDFSVAAIPNPTISVTSATMCFGTSAELVASDASTYAWSPAGSLSSSTGATVTASPNVTTIYTIIGSSLNCNSPSQTATVDVIANPTVFISSPDATICPGTTIPLTGNGAASYTWSPAATLDNTTNSVVNASPMTTTNYVLIGSLNSCTAAATKQVVVLTLPTLQATIDKPVICAGDKANINANGAGTYSWFPPIGLDNITSNFVVASPAQSTTYIVRGSNGICTATFAISVDVIPVPLLNISTSNQKICAGDKTTIFASGAQNFNWLPSDNISNPSPGSAIVSPASSTNYTITGYNTAGSLTCSMAKEIFIQVVPQVTATVGSSVVICNGESVKLNAGGGNTFIWTPTENINDNRINQPFVNPQTTTVYSVLVSTDGNCGTTATVLVKVNPTPTVNAGSDQIINLDEPMYLDAKGTGTMKWILGEGIICVDCPNSQITPKNSGTYIIETINEFGCKAQDEVYVEVTKDHNIYIPNIFTPNFDGNNDVFLVYGTGITKLEMLIFDRWGEKLFTSTDQLKGWDGTHKGVSSKNDAYVYLINYTTLDGKKHTRTGHVTLMK